MIEMELITPTRRFQTDWRARPCAAVRAGNNAAVARDNDRSEPDRPRASIGKSLLVVHAALAMVALASAPAAAQSSAGPPIEIVPRVSATISSLAFSPDGARVLAGGND